MSHILAEVIGDHLLASANAERAQATLERALGQEMTQSYPGGRTVLLDHIRQHLKLKEAVADEASRLWIVAVMLVVQGESAKLTSSNPR